MGKSICVSTIGRSWMIIPEIIGFIRPDVFDFYRNHPEADQIQKIRQKYLPSAISELWIVTTCLDPSDRMFQQISEWYKSISSQSTSPLKLLLWMPDQMKDITTERESDEMRNLIFEIILAAKKETETDSHLVLSLTGGRKTMSSDMQYGASVFGCDLLFHIFDHIPAQDKRNEINAIMPENLVHPPDSSISAFFRPAVIGSFQEQISPGQFAEFKYHVKNEILLKDIHLRYLSRNTLLLDKVRQISQSGIHLYLNLNQSSIYKQYPFHFKGIYSLHPGTLDRLEKIRFGTQSEERQMELELMRKFPKAELHFHLGGSLTPGEMIEAACLLEEEIFKYRKIHPNYSIFLDRIKQFVHSQDLIGLKAYLIDQTQDSEYPEKKMRYLFPEIPEPFTVAGFLVQFKEHEQFLDNFIYGKYTNSTKFRKIGIEAYERLGDLQGSGLLQHSKIIEYTVDRVCKKLIEDGVRYVEIRCSPINYTRGGLRGLEVYETICEVLDRYRDQLKSRILIIASRHGKMSKIYEHIELIEQIYDPDHPYKSYLAGVDLAGNESVQNPEKMRIPFLKVMEKNLHITIHAGETEGVKNIWEAIYHLNAERIGHALRLKEEPELMRKVLDRQIGLELCPSSNDQIVGFPAYPDTGVDSSVVYPLHFYLKEHLQVTINTDNWGISRTSLSQEYIKAAELSPNGLSLLAILQIIKNGFEKAFLPFQERVLLMEEVEREILSTLEKEVLCPNSYW